MERRRIPNRGKFLEDQKAQSESRALERYHTRDFKAGDIYAPHDLSPTQMKKWGKRQSPNTDAFDALNLKPLDMYKVNSTEAQPIMTCMVHSCFAISTDYLGFFHRTLRSCPNT